MKTQTYICCLYFGLTNLCCCSAGLTPQVTNPAGQRPYVCYSELSRCYTMVHAAVLRADKTQLHEHQRKSQNTNEKVFLAFPNDRATSLRPADADTEYRCAQRLQRAYFSFSATAMCQINVVHLSVFWFSICRTIFTGVRRYHYLDTTFAFTEEEEKQRQQHKQIYMDFLSRRRQTYLQKIKERFGVFCTS